jgi:predicted XRE-type DNA-binding protein
MGFPKKSELERVKKKLAKLPAVRLLPSDASKADKLKFELCKQFVTYLQEEDISQLALAKQLEIDPARLNEIVKYRIDLFTVDRLLGYAEQLNPKLKVTVG